MSAKQDAIRSFIDIEHHWIADRLEKENRPTYAQGRENGELLGEFAALSAYDTYDQNADRVTIQFARQAVWMASGCPVRRAKIDELIESVNSFRSERTLGPLKWEWARGVVKDQPLGAAAEATT